MKNRNGVKWSREETILALDLYCKIPFGKISQTNKNIIKLAELLGRTPGSVGLKMHNLAHYDPYLQQRNVTAMAHGSKQDARIYSEFADNWTELAYQAFVIKARMKNIDIQEVVNVGEIELIPPGKSREQIIKTRVGQYFFRISVLNAYNNRCCVTGISKSDLLVASHIKPWKVSDEQTEQTNPSNGLCLNSLHDKAFDRGLITITYDFKIWISDAMKTVDMDDRTKEWFMGYNHQQINLPDKFLPGRRFIEYHNDVIFQG
ncbi:HNH endonuclease [[Clostridium] symbiosum]|uniref:HNH endonuclease n=1 Tax=Clostridium symbiosum TaxID=1512 RepID=UPI0006C78C01|nr:HNH endonuclease [[Clostridium] symbiosum]MDB2037654.1 HNH endonuclease [[Clostridium] symbiosum]